ncbi:MAG: hypothetical protein MI976_14955 [Pseudomonadales bacterium]|nr:hypothetical protein [Pseudomonadales bacterium]
MVKIFTLMLAILVFTGCTAVPIQQVSDEASSRGSMMHSQSELKASLFASDTSLLSNEAVKEILESKWVLPEDPKIALLNLSNNQYAVRHYGWSYWRSESYMDQQQRYVESLSSKVLSSSIVSEVVTIPKIMIDKNMALPQMREAAVRLQADLLVIYTLTSDIFVDQRLFQQNQIKAYATCEAVLFDSKTGIIPFSSILTKKHQTVKGSGDLNDQEARKRAESEASMSCLSSTGDKMAEFFAKQQ